LTGGDGGRCHDCVAVEYCNEKESIIKSTRIVAVCTPAPMPTSATNPSQQMPRVAKAKASQTMANAHRVSGHNGETRVRSPSTESFEPPKPKHKKGKKGGKVLAILLDAPTPTH
jgi:hypothetical protein